LEIVDLPRLWYVLIYPNFEVSTRWAYQNYRLTKKKFHLKIQEFLTTPEDVCKILMNDLEEVVSEGFLKSVLMKNASQFCRSVRKFDDRKWSDRVRGLFRPGKRLKGLSKSSGPDQG